RILPKVMCAPSLTVFLQCANRELPRRKAASRELRARELKKPVCSKLAALGTQYVESCRCRLQPRFSRRHLLARAGPDPGTRPHAHQETDRALWHSRARLS